MRLLPVLSLLATLVLGASPVLAAKRVALVIGNSEYQNVAKLGNPANDAKLVAQTLRDLGFTLVGGGAQSDLSKADLDKAVQHFGNDLIGAEVGLFYYAGHGVQVHDANYLVPVDANPVKEADVDFQMLNVSLVMRQMEGSGTRLNVVILDACRNNPFAGRGLRSTNGGLAQMQAPEGSVISYATQPGNVAQDGKDGNSPFTEALAQSIREPGKDVIEVFNAVGLAVKRATGGNQQPWLSISPIDGKFYFAAASAGVTETENRPQSATPAFDERAVELSYWETARVSRSPAVVQSYLDRYPNGMFAALAQARLEELKAREAKAAERSGGLLSRLLVPRTSQKASMDCVQPIEPMEVLICADAELAEWDGRLGDTFKRRLERAADKIAFRREEREWIIERARKCFVPKTGKWTAADLVPAKACVLAMTKERVRVLDSR